MIKGRRRRIEERRGIRIRVRKRIRMAERRRRMMTLKTKASVLL